MSDPLLVALVSNTAVAALLGSAGWCIAHLGRRPAAAHLLFVLALVKLVTPPLWELEVGRSRAAEAAEGEVQVAPRTVDDASSRVPASRPASTPQEAQSRTADGDVAGPALRQPARSWSWREAAIGIWVLGAIGFAVLALHRARRLLRLLALAREPDAAIAAEVDVARRRVGLRRAPRILVVDATIPPLVFATGWRPTLVVPDPLPASLDAATRIALWTHELAHVRRGDVWLRWVETAIRIAMWWHPLSWWLIAELRAAEERACDRHATANVSPLARRSYAEALLSFATARGTVPNFVSPAVRGRGLRSWKRRLEDVMTAETAPRPTLLFRLAVLALGAVLLPFAVAQESDAASPSLAERLERTELEFAITEAPLTDWSAYLAKTARLNIVVDEALLDADPRAGTLRDLKLPKTSLRRILDVITALTDVHWSIEGEVLRLHSADRRAAEPPPTGRAVRVHGAVQAPGRVAIQTEETLLGLIARLELTDEADLSAVRMLRTGDEPLSVVVDVDGMLRTGDTAHNLRLMPGDIVTVPDRLPDDLPPLTLRPGVEVRFVVDPLLYQQPGMEQLRLLTEPQRVQRDGTIFVPYVGPTSVVGMTRDEVSAAITRVLDQSFSVPVRVWARLD